MIRIHGCDYIACMVANDSWESGEVVDCHAGSERLAADVTSKRSPYLLVDEADIAIDLVGN